MKAKILLIHNGYPVGEQVGDKIRVINMANSLKNIGFDVYLLAFYKKGFTFLSQERSKLPVGIKSIFFYTLPDRWGLVWVASIIRAIITWLIVKKHRIRVVQIETSLSGSCVRFLDKDVKVVTDFHADPVPELQMLGRSQNYIDHTIKDIKYILSRSQMLLTVSDNLRNNLKHYYPFSSETAILPCSFNENLFADNDINDAERLRKELNLEDRIVLCYLGGTHKWQCIEETLDLCVRLRALDSRYFVCIFTNGDMSPYQEKLSYLKDSYMCKALPYASVPLYLSTIDVGFVLRQNSLVNINASPTKSSEYLASGAFLVSTQYAGDAPSLVTESGCGFILNDINPSDEEVKKMHAEILSFVQNRAFNAKKARSFAFKERVWGANEQKLYKIYKGFL